ncbi:hypothetical protein BDP27DRAFT_1318185 [Rhodocollybia butyracea]|uniref:HIT domain-containing protein n=1 Tax=Rhodocollybia butyracea TaxID=206335 RepID=A0A9P5Q381_9AGAR|nr:hypothetical protein BDP27DRAFT_1318185 [Rhodocollybia butyracea]
MANSMFAPKLGCPMCSLVASALPTPSNPWRTTVVTSDNLGSNVPEVLWRDDNFTAYREKANPVSSRGHVIIAFNLHVPSLYTLSATDLPLLVNVRNIALRLLSALDTSPPSSASISTSIPLERNSRFHIGFITPPFKDNKIPVTDHLHCHAYIEPSDFMGWFRGISYSTLAWYAIDDLIAEIRESVSNNRVKSGYNNRRNAPIDRVPQAGARSGTANGQETTEAGLPRIEHDLEAASSTVSPHHPLRT